MTKRINVWQKSSNIYALKFIIFCSLLNYLLLFFKPIIHIKMCTSLKYVNYKINKILISTNVRN